MYFITFFTFCMQDNSSSLSLNWILETLAAQIESDDENNKFVIDVMPSLRYFFKVPGLIKDCSAPLKEFEKKVSSPNFNLLCTLINSACRL